jgi:hypothetical protein
MSKKYLPEVSSTIVTNDLYLAAFLHCVGCTIDHAQRNDRRRMSFVFIGERVRELREAYRTGPVRLDLRSFRESLSHIRRLMDGGEQRSTAHEREPVLQAIPHT